MKSIPYSNKQLGPCKFIGPVYINDFLETKISETKPRFAYERSGGCSFHPSLLKDWIDVSKIFMKPLTLLHSERPKLYTVLAFLSAIKLNAY